MSTIQKLVLLGIFSAVASCSKPPATCARCGGEGPDEATEGAAQFRTSGEKRAAVARLSADSPATVVAPTSGSFSPQIRLGFHVDAEWEPAIAADRFGHVYVLYAQYGGVPGCSSCFSPTVVLQKSADHGLTWGSPTVMFPAGSTAYQVDTQIVVDPVDGRTVFASWLQNNKADVVVARSIDFGASWAFVTASSTNSGTDKPILAVRGQDVYVVYNHSQTIWVSYSHDGGASFQSAKINANAKLGWSLAGGGTVASGGQVYFAWAGYEQSGGAKGKVNLFVSKSIDGGGSWTTKQIDVSESPPDCSAFKCGWAYLGPQMTIASDADTLYVLWNAGSVARGPERVYFSRSTDGGATWSTKQEVSTAPAGTHHGFPAIAVRGTGDVRISWMDSRAAAGGGMDRWNTYYRSSSDSGATWSAETDVSTPVTGYTYVFSDGFRFPYGDYYEMDVDERGVAHLVWGEGNDYDQPGSIWYSQGML